MVKINNEFSDRLNILIGIPQGTIIGPLLFIMYINSLLNLNTQGIIISYADDTVLVFEDNSWKSVKDKAELCFAAVKKWLDYNKLSLNVDKTKFIAFSIDKKKRNRPDFNTLRVIDKNILMKETDHICYLGIIIDT